MTYKPMLADKADLAKIVYPICASYKLDGVRALIMPRTTDVSPYADKPPVVSRSLKPLPNKHIQMRLSLYGNFDGFDGEIIVGPPNAPDVFRRTQSFTSSKDKDEPFTYYVFDHFLEPNRPYTQRFSYVKNRIRMNVSKIADIVVWENRIIRDEKELLKYEEEALSKGYEGIMIRAMDGRYKYGRSTQREGFLLKLKRYEDSEAEIIGFLEEMKNDNMAYLNELGHTARSMSVLKMSPKGRLGALAVRDLKTRVEFAIGSGLTDEDKKWIWENQQDVLWNYVVKYKSFNVGVKEKPRFPVFLGLRHINDMSE